jgi:hypothetical protein
MSNNSPLTSAKNIPLELVVPLLHSRRYTKSQDLLKFAEQVYHETGRGITFEGLRKSGKAKHKSQAQLILKHAKKVNILFTLSEKRPQEYYPNSLRSEIIKKEFSKNTPIEVTGVAHCKQHNDCTYDVVVRQTLEDYVVPLLPSAPLFVHKLQLQTKINPERYNEIRFKIQKGNKAKKCGEIIGNNNVTYLFYPNGTVVISVENSNNPSLENEEDRSYLLTYFGQIRDRLIMIMADPHERFVPPILKWYLTQCDVNKDIPVGDWLQVTCLKTQVRHLDQLFRIYIKSMGEKTVCRCEKSVCLKKRTCIEAINEFLDSNERTNKLLTRILEEVMGIKNSFANENPDNSSKFDSSYRIDINEIN